MKTKNFPDKHYHSIFKLVVLFISFSISYAFGQAQAPASDVFNGARGTNFNLNWKFNLGDVTGAQNPSFDDSGWKSLNLPHDWSIELSFDKNSPAGSGGGYLDGGIGWYRKTFTLPSSDAGKRITIQFEGIYMNSTVWINGHFLGTRPYGYSTFEYNLTPYIHTGTTKNVIAVKVDNNQPNSRWYSGSGIYRNVWLTVTDPVHIAYCGTFVTTSSISSTSANITATTKIENNSSSDKIVSVVTSIYDKNWHLVTTKVSSPFPVMTGKDSSYVFNYKITNPTLWSLDNPYLYNIRTQIVDNRKVLDKFETTFGIRKLTLNPNTGFWLNGKHIKLLGVCMHHDLGSLGAAQNYRALERQVEILKSFGCNAIRTSHNPPAPELLEICDRLGLVVMDEAFDCWEKQKTANDYHLYFDTWAQQDVHDWIIRDRNHPSVIMWSIGNEIPEQGTSMGLATAKKLIGWVHNDDTTRPITQALNKRDTIGPILDAVGYNYGTGSNYDTDHAKHPDWVIFGSETSSAFRTRGVYHLPTTQNIQTSPDMQCSSYDNSVASWGESAETAWQYDKSRAFVGGEFIWTGFDYIGEPTPYGWPAKSSYFGIVDMCGFPKDIYYFYKSQWTTAPMVHLLPHWNWNPGDIIPVWAYTNCDSVKLTLNGKSLGTQINHSVQPFHIEWRVPFGAGTVKAYAYRNGVVAATDSIVTAGIASQVKLKADRDTIYANGTDLSFIETDILDSHGTLVPEADNQVTYSVTGPGKIVGVDNGNPISLESFKGSTRKAFNGKCLAIVQSTGAVGTITVNATTPSLINNIAYGKPSNADSEEITQLTNIALNKPATADSYQSSNPIASGNDGSTSTRWCASDQNAGHWWMVDLGSTKSLIGSEITWEHNFAYQYKIETSTDKTNWTLAVDKTANTTAAQVMSDTFNASGRYVRITITSSSSSNWASFFEFKLFDGSTTVSPNKKLASNANDGNLDSYWSAADGNAGHSWGVDLGADYNINKTQVVWENPGVAYEYKIETSTDSAQWNLAVDKTTNRSTEQVQTDSFSVKTARYIRVIVTGGTSSINKAAISEFRVYDGSTIPVRSGSVIIQCIKPPCQNCLVDSVTANPWANINQNGWIQTDSVVVGKGGNVSLSTLPTDSANWQWSGPNGFSANTATVTLENVQLNDSGIYIATQGNTAVKFKVVVKNTDELTQLDSQLRLFPNPSKDGIFNLSNCDNGMVTVYNGNGTVVYNDDVNSSFYKLNLKSQPRGVYIVRLKSDNRTTFKKIIIS